MTWTSLADDTAASGALEKIHITSETLLFLFLDEIEEGEPSFPWGLEIEVILRQYYHRHSWRQGSGGKEAMRSFRRRGRCRRLRLGFFLLGLERCNTRRWRRELELSRFRQDSFTCERRRRLRSQTPPKITDLEPVAYIDLSLRILHLLERLKVAGFRLRLLDGSCRPDWNISKSEGTLFAGRC